jgi:phosphoenolpyruvate-protein kinase (PTS system EI component)
MVGRVASEGIAFGPSVVIALTAVPDDLATDAVFEEVARTTADRLEELAARVRDEGRAEEAEVLEAYAMMATDPALGKDVAARTRDGAPLVAAIRAAVAGVAAAFAAMDDEYFRQRADDVGCVSASEARIAHQ